MVTSEIGIIYLKVHPWPYAEEVLLTTTTLDKDKNIIHTSVTIIYYCIYNSGRKRGMKGRKEVPNKLL